MKLVMSLLSVTTMLGLSCSRADDSSDKSAKDPQAVTEAEADTGQTSVEAEQPKNDEGAVVPGDKNANAPDEKASASDAKSSGETDQDGALIQEPKSEQDVDLAQGDKTDQGAGVVQGDKPDQGADVVQGDKPDQGTDVVEADKPDQGVDVVQGDKPDQGTDVVEGDKPDQGVNLSQGDKPDQGANLAASDKGDIDAQAFLEANGRDALITHFQERLATLETSMAGLTKDDALHAQFDALTTSLEAMRAAGDEFIVDLAKMFQDSIGKVEAKLAAERT